MAAGYGSGGEEDTQARGGRRAADPPARDCSDDETAVPGDDGEEAFLEEVHAVRRRLEAEKSLRRQEEEERDLLMERVKHISVARQGGGPLSGASGREDRPGSRRRDDEEEEDGEDAEIPGSREKLLACVQQHIEQCNELEAELERERGARWSALQASMEADNSLEKTKKLEDALKKQARLEAQIADMEHRAWVADLSQIQMQAMQKRRDVHALQLLLQKEESRRRQLIQEITSVQEMKERAMKYIGTRSTQFVDDGAAQDGDQDSG